MAFGPYDFNNDPTNQSFTASLEQVDSSLSNFNDVRNENRYPGNLRRNISLRELTSALSQPTVGNRSLYPNLEGRTPLMQAASEGDKAKVNELVTTGVVDINDSDLSGKTAIMLALKAGHIEIVMRLLECEKIDFDHTDNNGNTLLSLIEAYIALNSIDGRSEEIRDMLLCLMQSNGNLLQTPAEIDSAIIDAIENKQGKQAEDLILKYKVDVNHRYEYGETALILACLYDQKDLVNTLLCWKADPLAFTRFGRTALMFAGQAGNIEIVKLLLENSAVKDSISIKDASGDTVLNIVDKFRKIYLGNNSYDDIEDILLATGGKIVLMQAAHEGNKNRVKKSLQFGVDLNASDVMDAMKAGNMKLAMLLLECCEGIDIDHTDNNGNTLPFLIEQHLIFNPTDVDAKELKTTLLVMKESKSDQSRDTAIAVNIALINAIKKGELEKAIKLIMENNANFNYCDECGSTPLMLAARYDLKKLVEVLIGCGADPLAANKFDETALMHACKSGNEEIVQLLLECPGVAESAPLMKNIHGQTAFNIAAEKREMYPLDVRYIRIEAMLLETIADN